MWQILKKKKVYIPILTIFAVYSIFLFKASHKPIQNSLPTTTQTPTSEEIELARQAEIDAIRNRTFPLAGGPNDAGMETGDDMYVRPAHGEPILKKYGGIDILTDEKLKVVTKFYDLGNVVRNKYGYTEYNPSRTSKGLFVDVVFTLENNQNISQTFSLTDIKLVDQNNREYTPLKQSGYCGIESLSANTTEIVAELGPSVPCEISLLFETSTSSNLLHIEFLAP